MDFNKYVRKPFMIEAVQITPENIQDVCDFIGHEIRHKDGQPYIVVDKKKIPNGYRAYVGQWVTKMGDNIRCYPKRVFDAQFIDYGPEWATWFEDEEPEKEEVLERLGFKPAWFEEEPEAQTFQTTADHLAMADDARLDETRDSEYAAATEEPTKTIIATSDDKKDDLLKHLEGELYAPDEAETDKQPDEE